MTTPGTGGFNPRPRVGGDGRAPALRMASHPVSIHAPAWGATWRMNSHSAAFEAFQSTPPRGGRPVTGRSLLSLLMGFNPRPRVGGDYSIMHQ